MQSVCADIETLCSHLNAACLKMLTDDLCRLVPSPISTTTHTHTHTTHTHVSMRRRMDVGMRAQEALRGAQLGLKLLVYAASSYRCDT
jgi:hypothetical protein